MAELCVQQGHDDEALAIYEQLAAQRPDDARLAERLATVRTRLGRAAAPTISEPAGEYLRALAEGQPAPAESAPAERAPVEAGDEAAGVSELTLEYPTPTGNDAIAAPPTAAPPSERDRWAASAWSGAFRADAAPAQPIFAHLTPRDATPDLSFDRFFAGLEEEPSPSEAEPQAAAREEQPPQIEAAAQDADHDLAEFNAWLRGLRDA
jgi:hypothetical protein